MRISAKHLGDLALDSCERCFQIKVQLSFKLPYQVFPGIFSSIDSYSKKITDEYYNRMGIVPPWLGIQGRPVKVPSIQQFQWFDEETGVLLTGVPDSVIQKDDGSYAIIDYKTARYTNGQDELLPLYRVQLNGHALIAEHNGMNPVSDLMLIYYEPFTDIKTSNVGYYIAENGFTMLFESKTLTLEREGVHSLMRRAVEIYNSDPLEHTEGCKERHRIVDFVGVL